MSSKIVINNPAGDVSINGVTGSLPIPSSEGMTLISSGSSWTTSSASHSWRNRIINGDMRVAQRGTSAVSTTLGYPVDRFRIVKDSNAVVSVTQSSTVPSGFSNSIGWTVTTGGSCSGSQGAQIQQIIEGTSVYDFSFGTAAAKTITISFWVQSSITGKFCCTISNAINRSYITEYTVLAQNTWEKKTITIPGDVSGIWLTGAVRGMLISWDLGSGSTLSSTASTWLSGDYSRTSSQTNLIGTTGATFYITGVQLEIGTIATPYELIPYDKQLQLCQRYYARLSQQSVGTNQLAFAVGTSTVTGTISVNGQSFIYIKYPQQMRATPTLTSPASTGCAILSVASVLAISSIGSAYYGSDSLGVFINTALSTQTRGNSVLLVTNNNATGYVELNAEL